MIDWLQIKYVNLLSSSLEQFKQTHDYTWNFRCPICGDSQKSKSKVRGYLLGNNGNLRFFCHNCQRTLRFTHFLEQVNSSLHQQYVIERIAQGKQEKKIFDPGPKTVYQADKYLQQITKISKLPPDHECKKYVVSRQIPTTYHHKLFYARHFKGWINTIIKAKFDLSKSKDQGRLVIPLFDLNGKLIACQGRDMTGTSAAKYMTIVFDETKPILYGCDVVNFNRDVFVFEGPINSMFVENSISALGTSAMIEQVGKLDIDQKKIIFCFDNEPRNKEIARQMLSAINKGYRVVVWPKYYQTGLDINDLVLKRVNDKQFCKTESSLMAGQTIKSDLINNVFSGLPGQLKIAEWRKC